jgi:hypothetical protein
VPSSCATRHRLAPRGPRPRAPLFRRAKCLGRGLSHRACPPLTDSGSRETPGHGHDLSSGGRARTCNNQLQRPDRSIQRVSFRALTCGSVRRRVQLVVSCPGVLPEFGTGICTRRSHTSMRSDLVRRRPGCGTERSAGPPQLLARARAEVRGGRDHRPRCPRCENPRVGDRVDARTADSANWVVAWSGAHGPAQRHWPASTAIAPAGRRHTVCEQRR